MTDATEPGASKSALSDDELLAICKEERVAAVGLDSQAELLEGRETALNYFKGVMDDVPALEGRSSVVSTDISDAVETALPDLLEIFIGGEDVATFRANGENDEQAAEQETDYVNHTVFQLNDGFTVFYSAIKDALLCKVGVFKTWSEIEGEIQEESLTGKTALELQDAFQDGWQVEGEIRPSEYQAEPIGQSPPEQLFDADLVRDRRCTKVKLAAVSPEHFAVAKDTVSLPEATYCCMRSHPRAQQLIADGYDADKVEDLPPWIGDQDGSQRARDTAGEEDMASADTVRDMRQVEITEHYVRVLNPDTGELDLWMVVTGHDESVLLDKKRVERIPFSAITPYMQPHRFYGRSLADLLIEIQRIRTVLLRMALDSGYFALNQRMEIALDQCSDTTIEDYLDNRPNRPVLSRSGEALRPLQSGGLSFDPWSALEFTAVQAEQRTGVVRNAQGLNPDTLHDTARGAMVLMGAAQKRIRMMARIFAETGVKQMYLNVHALLRDGPAQPSVVKLRGSWVPVDPTSWDARDDMDIRVGVGSGGKDQDIAALREVLMTQAQLIQAQGGPKGPMVGLPEIYAAMKRFYSRLGIRNSDDLIKDPKPFLQQQAATPQPPPPNPDMIKAQADIQLDRQKALASHQLNVQKAQSDTQLKQLQAQTDAALETYKANLAAQSKHEQMLIEAQLKSQQMQADALVHVAPPQVHFGGQVG